MDTACYPSHVPFEKGMGNLDFQEGKKMPKTAEQLAKESENKSYSNLGKTLLILQDNIAEKNNNNPIIKLNEIPARINKTMIVITRATNVIPFSVRSRPNPTFFSIDFEYFFDIFPIPLS